jgi:hypothetical protein
MLEKRRAQLQKLLASPRAPLFAAIVAVALAAPTIGLGLLMDDFVHRAAFSPELRVLGGPRGDWDLFNFQGPDRGYLRYAMDKGLWPWWVAPEFRLAFFRPVAALSHALDYRVWPDAAWLMHIENIAIYALMALFAALVYKRHTKPAWAAGLAALFFAVDDAHSSVVLWIASRNALLAVTFGFAALVAHDRGRQGSRAARFLAPVLFALGLLSGETALGTAGYLAAYALFLDTESGWSRARSLLPYAGVGLAWLTIYKILGYGAYGGGFYIDPGSEPLVFLKAFVGRVPLLLLAQLAGPPAELWVDLPQETLAVIVASVAALIAALGVLLYRVIGRDPAARFFATGMLLSLIPVSATWPNDRLLLLPGLGAFGLVALFIARAADAAGRAERILAKSIAVLFVFLHGVAAPVLLPVRALTFGGALRGYVERADKTLPSDPGLEGSTLVVLNAPDILVPNYVYADRHIHRGAIPTNIRQLAVIHKGTAEIARVDAHTLAMTQSEGFMHEMWSLVVRGPSVPFRVGDTVAVQGMRVEIAELQADGRPRRVLFRFDEPLDSPALRWVRWEKNAFVLAAPPAEGETVPIPPINFAKAVFGTE